MSVVPSDLFQVLDTHSSFKETGYQVLVYNGSQVMMTNHRFLSHNYEKISFKKFL